MTNTCPLCKGELSTDGDSMRFCVSYDCPIAQHPIRDKAWLALHDLSEEVARAQFSYKMMQSQYSKAEGDMRDHLNRVIDTTELLRDENAKLNVRISELMGQIKYFLMLPDGEL